MLSRAMTMARANRATVYFFAVSETMQEKNGFDSLKELIQPEAEPSCKIVFAEATGKPVEQILNAIRDYEVDLVIMGHHSRTPMSLEALGSVAFRVIPRSNCPVLVVRD